MVPCFFFVAKFPHLQAVGGSRRDVSPQIPPHGAPRGPMQIAEIDIHTGNSFQSFAVLQFRRVRRSSISCETSKIYNMVRRRNSARTIRGFGYLDEEMGGLQMERKDYEYYLKLRNLALKLAFSDTLNVYFHRVMVKLDELALSSKIDECFAFLAESFECIEEEIFVR